LIVIFKDVLNNLRNNTYQSWWNLVSFIQGWKHNYRN
jgi:hypothetical protein